MMRLGGSEGSGERLTPYRVGTAAQVLDIKKRHSVCGVSLVLRFRFRREVRGLALYFMLKCESVKKVNEI